MRTRVVISTLLWTVTLLVVQFIIGAWIVHRHPDWVPHVHNSMMLLAVVIVLVVGLVHWRVGISPLGELRHRVTALRDGRAARLEGRFPSELQALADDLNALLDARDDRVRKAEAQAADLAHSLKTPLAVLAHDAEYLAAAGQDVAASSIRAQIDRMRRQTDWHLARARATAAGAAPPRRTLAAAAAAGLTRALMRLHHDRIAIDVDIPAELAVAVPQPDLEEILGNLMDNACRHARTRVWVRGAGSDGMVTLTIADDGAGLDTAARSAVLERGVRADEQSAGTGLGLAIARELTEIYGGRLALDHAAEGGLAAMVTLPAGAAPTRPS
jgi:signal transduction histidine kinase